MPREILTPEERQARLKARKQRNHAKNRERRLALMRTYHHAKRATMTPEELEAHRADGRKRAARYADTHREAINTKHREQYWANPEKPRAKRRAFGMAHREQETAAKRRYREANLEKVRDSGRRWRAAHADAVKVRMAAWREANPDKKRYPETQRAYNLLHAEDNRARVKEWVQANPERANVNKARHRARIRNAAINDLTAEQRQAIIDAAHGVCPYCAYYAPNCPSCRKGTHKLSVDHITALYNGGNHTLHNLIACCRACNSKKHTSPNPVPVQPLLL
jgi:5-methylcytosine-specific restriction endonuclease McrA